MSKQTIEVGDRFYQNTYVVRRNLALPNMLRVLSIDGNKMRVLCEYYTIGIKEFEMTMDNVLFMSNRNPGCMNPIWIFLDSKDANKKGG